MLKEKSNLDTVILTDRWKLLNVTMVIWFNMIKTIQYYDGHYCEDDDGIIMIIYS